ncbi:MAG: dynamin family protein [Myxococcales bacterium]|nr:dynamin family protein [Myxococcales bacterium]
MAPLFESISRLAERVEILARGLEGDRRAAELMLERGRPLDAREHARAILVKVPGSPLGLALWADAAEAAWLDHEAVQALTELSRAVPWRGDVWLRLGRAAHRVGDPQAREALERAAAARDDRVSSRRALLDLCDMDLAVGDAARALRWLDRIPAPLQGRDEPALLRRAECALARGASAEAREIASSLDEALGEDGPFEEREPGRRAAVLARSLWATAESDAMVRARATSLAVRAFVLDAPGARELLATVVASTTDAVLLADLRAVAAGAGLSDEPIFTASFALAEGRRGDARAALVRALAGGDAGAERALLRLALDARDEPALAALADRRPMAVPEQAKQVLAAGRALAAGEPARVFELLEGATGEVEGWADDLRARAARALVESPQTWPVVVEMLLGAARSFGTVEDLVHVESLVAERKKPIVAAVVGEFNAGKSTFINALLGVDVAPTGILPTTATLHRVAYAPDPFVRVLVRGAADRVVPHEGLKPTLAKLREEGARIDRVQIYAPIERLRWVEVLDTPGFNAPDPEHAKEARGAFEEADLVVWLLDGTGAMKASEAAILKEVTELGIPVLVLLNKLDRLGTDNLGRVLSHTKEGLAEIGLEPHAGVLGFSAKLALAGRLGDEAALERSNWPAVESMLNEVVVDRADELRERSMRRKAARIVSELGAIVNDRAEAESRRGAEERARAEALRAAAARLAQEAEEAAAWLEGATEVERRALDADLRPLTQLGEGVRDEIGARTFAGERLVTRLAGVITLRLAEQLGVVAPPDAVAMVASALEGVALAVTNPEDLVGPGARRALVAGVRAASRAFALEAETAPTASVGAGAQKRLAALGAALTRPSRESPAADGAVREASPAETETR